VSPLLVPVSNNDDHNELDVIGDNGHLAGSVSSEPRLFCEAMTCEDAQRWVDAFAEEMAAHELNGTWELVECPPGVKPIGSHWVLKIKHYVDGSIKRYKAHLVAKGFAQHSGIDYFETFAPTVKLVSICVVLALAAALNLHLCSIDVSNAFLNGDIDANMYMEQPEGFVIGGRHIVCKLRKGLYGTRQGARAWQINLQQILVEELQFRMIYSDGSFFVYCNGDDFVMLPFHVDDGTFGTSSNELATNLIGHLSQHFKLRDLGPTTFLLGIAVSQDRVAGCIELSQRQYVLDILECFGFSSCSPVVTPMIPGLRLSKSDAPSTDDEHAEMANLPYANAVGVLLYLAMATQPGIAYAVSVLCRFIANPGLAHWHAVKHVFRYLRGTAKAQLVYRRNTFDAQQLFSAFVDADDAGNLDNGHSTGGYALLIAGGAVSWSSHLQSITALSTTEAEYVAAVDAGKDVVWMRQLLGELGFTLSAPSVLCMDNQSAISVAKNPEHHGPMKHLDLRFYWLRNVVDSGLIMPVFVPTTAQVADIFTKLLARANMERCRLLLGVEI